MSRLLPQRSKLKEIKDLEVWLTLQSLAHFRVIANGGIVAWYCPLNPTSANSLGLDLPAQAPECKAVLITNLFPLSSLIFICKIVVCVWFRMCLQNKSIFGKPRFWQIAFSQMVMQEHSGELSRVWKWDYSLFTSLQKLVIVDLLSSFYQHWERADLKHASRMLTTSFQRNSNNNKAGKNVCAYSTPAQNLLSQHKKRVFQYVETE